MASARTTALRLMARAQSLSRALASAAEPAIVVAPTEIKYKSNERCLEVGFNTGERFRYPAEYLRVESPAAGNQDSLDAKGRQKVVSGRREVGVIAVEPVGSYAIRLQFDDMHGSGIFSWPYLHQLGREKWARMRRYIRTLHERGLTRDPPRRRRQAAPPQQQQQRPPS